MQAKGLGCSDHQQENVDPAQYQHRDQRWAEPAPGPQLGQMSARQLRAGLGPSTQQVQQEVADSGAPDWWSGGLLVPHLPSGV